MSYIYEPAKKVKVIARANICVIGGSCTGLFAAIRAARLGAKVVLIEKQNCFGGTATSGLVNVWHSLHDFDNNEQIIGGLTHEVIEKLDKLGAIRKNLGSKHSSYVLNTEELKIELDNLVKENKIEAFLHTYYCGVIAQEDTITHVLVENKDGRGAIEADFFIDASGDGDVARDLKLEGYYHGSAQPPTYCFYMQGKVRSDELGAMIAEHGAEFGLEDDWGWYNDLVNSPLSMRADFHVFNKLCDRAADLTDAEIEGRQKMRALVKMLKAHGDPEQNYNLIASCSQIGIRETIHYKTRFKANEMDLLLGKEYNTRILKGTYRIDIHHADDFGITFKNLDGYMHTDYGKSGKRVEGNWREDLSLSGDYAQFYQLPFEAIVTKDYKNFIPAGRMLNADEGAFGALRVMVNLNQVGEAAGVAAFLAVDRGTDIRELDGEDVKELLNKGGSAL